jgi:hypothetical protein
MQIKKLFGCYMLITICKNHFLGWLVGAVGGSSKKNQEDILSQLFNQFIRTWTFCLFFFF